MWLLLRFLSEEETIIILIWIAKRVSVFGNIVSILNIF